MQPQGIVVKVVIHLQPQPRLKTEVPVNFEDFEVRARGTNGSVVT